MPGMTGRRLRRKRRDVGAVLRVMVSLARLMLVVFVSMTVGYAFYLALQWVASEGAHRSVGG